MYFFIFILFRIIIDIPVLANSEDPDQSLWDAMLIWVNTIVRRASSKHNSFITISYSASTLYEPRHDTTNKISVRQAKTQIRVFAVRSVGS